MAKKYLFILFTFFISSGYSQDKSNEQDSIDFNSLRQYPKKNSLPVKDPVIQIQQVQIPVESLDLRVNYWKNWTSFGININQAAFSDNWKGGGVTSLAIGGQFNYKLDYTKENKNYVSEVIVQYGKVKNKDQLEKKTNDRFFWDNKVSLKFSTHWNLFASLSFDSQFDKGFNYFRDQQQNEQKTLISRFMSPGYLTESLGIEFKYKTFYWLRLGTGTARQTFVLDEDIIKTNPGNFGVKAGHKARNELAFQLISNFEKDIFKNVRLTSRYSMFANYEHLEKLKFIDHRLEAQLTARVNKFVNVGFNSTAIFDNDAADKIQATEGLYLGLVYRFPN